MSNFFKRIVLLLLFLTSVISYGQSEDKNGRNDNKNDKDQVDDEKFRPNYDTWAVGAGFSNLVLVGDLLSFDTFSGDGYPNFGGYVYGNKMFNPVVGVEFRVNYSRVGGERQLFHDSGGLSETTYYRILYAESYRSDLLKIEGRSFGFESSLILSLDNLWKRHSKKWNWATYFGLGYQRYNSRLMIKDYQYDPVLGEDPTSIYSKNRVDPDGTIREANFGNNENRDFEGNAGSLYLNAGLGVKYRLNDKFDIEARAVLNLNNEDHLDAAISNKQVYETFYTGNLGVVYKFGNKEKYAIWVQDEEKEEDPFEFVDTDDDGVVDNFDKEINTPRGAEVYGSGIAIDSDKDGLKDYEDDCPLEPGPIERQGCPEPVVIVEPEPVVVIKEEEKQEIVEKITLLSKAIYFKTDSDELKTESFPPLNEISGVMIEYPDSRFKIEGNTDSRGRDSYNLDLSKRRAKRVYDYLTSRGINSRRLSSEGYGETRPIATNETEAGRQLNRRVEINFIDPDSEEGKLVYGQGVVIKKTATVVGSPSYGFTPEGMVPAVDSDGDGVVDMYDMEPNTPIQSRVYGNGVSVDSDMDDVPDYKDECPFAKGPVERNGCPLEGQKTIVPNVPVQADVAVEPSAVVVPVVEEANLPKVKKPIAVVENELKQLATQIKFARSEGHILKSNNVLILEQMGELLKDYESISVNIEVHTSDKPNLEYNLGLSKRRAYAINKHLTEVDGIDASRLTVKGMGGVKPKYDNDDKVENAKNNRVELTIK